MKLIGPWLVKKVPAFYGNRTFFTALTTASQSSLFWAGSMQSMPWHPTSRRSILILTSHLCLGLPSDPFPSDPLHQTLYAPLLSPMRATCPAHLILLEFIVQYPTRSADHKGLRYLVFSITLLPHPSYTHMSSSAPYSPKSSAYDPPIVWERPSFTPVQNKRRN